MNNVNLKKNNKGITLISLVITIIAIIILATVTINLMTSNGIMDKAKSAVDDNKIGEEKEKILIGYNKYKIDKYTQKNPELAIEGARTTGSESNGWQVMFTDTDNIYIVKSDGTIEKFLFNAEEWDKTAKEDDFFTWENDYTITGIKSPGCNSKIEEDVVRYPSKCKVIKGSEIGSINISINKIELPETISIIGDNAFKNYNMTEINIPQSVTSIGKNAFYECKNLENLYFSKQIINIGGNAFEGTKWLDNQPNGVIYIGKVLYKYKGDMPTNTQINVAEGTTQICSKAFYNYKGLINIVMPNSVTSIGDSAFYGCANLNNMMIPDGITSIEEMTFRNCRSLNGIIIPNNVAYIGDLAFEGCANLTNITVPSSVIYIGNEAFKDTKWLNNQADGMLYIGKVLYKYKGTMPTNSQISITEGTTQICYDAFSECQGLINVIIPNSITNISAKAFNNCNNLNSITLPNSVESIGDAAFMGCSSLNSIVIPNSVINMGVWTFCGWSSSQTINIRAKSKPDGWEDVWNFNCNAVINWKYTGE